MAQEKEETKTGILNSKYGKMVLVIFAALFVFGGPYLVYVLAHILDLNYFVSIASGFALFIVGFVLLWYLIKNKVVT